MNYDNLAIQKNYVAASMANQGALVGGAACQTTTEAGSEMNNLGQRIGVLLEMLSRHADRLQDVTDRLVGSEMSKEAAGHPPRPVPNGHIAQFNMALDEINSRMARAEDQVSRLQRAI